MMLPPGLPLWPVRGMRIRGAARLLAWLSLGLSALVACNPASATCFSDMAGNEADFNRRLNDDPAAVVTDLQARISRAETGDIRGQSVAQLYAMLMDALERNHRIDEAREAGARGLLALTPRDSDALRRRLTLMRIILLDEVGRIDEAAQQYDAASVAVPEDAPDYICVLVDRGYLHGRVGRQADAARELLKAYHLAEEGHFDVQRADIGSVLARVYIRYGLFDDALSIANDALGVLTRARDTDKLALAHLIRGDALVNRGNLDDALAEYELARSLFVQE